MLKFMEKLAELKRAKLLALSLLLIAAALFITTLLLPPTPWVSALKAISEAAMVGALADWFAVVALFRRIPLPLVARHTAIIPRNKDRIADNLGRFVEEKFLDTPSLVALIRRYEPALMLGNWFSQPENARRVGQHLLQVMSGFLELTDDARIQRLLRRAVHKAIDKVDLTQTSAMMLEGMTRDNRHQKLLDSLISQLIALLQRDNSRAFIARGIVRWLETEHPLKAKLLPTEWLGEHSAEMVTDAVNTLLDEVSHDRTHQIRQAFDHAVQKLIDNLKSDPLMAQKAENIKAYLKNDEDVADAIQDTILSCYENLKSLKQNRYFKTWMIRILINKCKDMIQKKKLVTYTDQMPETPFHEEKYAAMEWIQALEPLDSKYRLVVLLYYMEGFGIREISDILDMKESTVKSRLYRGRKQIAEMYGYKVKEGRA